MACGFSMRGRSMHRSFTSRPTFPRSRFASIAFSHFQSTLFSRRSSDRPIHTVHSRWILSSAVYRGDITRSLSGSRQSPLTRDVNLKAKPSSKHPSQSTALTKSEPRAKVEFRIKFRTEYGHRMKIVGNAIEFGSWSIAKSPSMKWNEGDIWIMMIPLPIGNVYEYKYVVTDAQGASVIHWQQGNNCVLAIGSTDKEMTVSDNWEGSPGAKVSSKGKGVSTKEERLLDWAEEMKSMAPDTTALVMEHKMEVEKIREESRLNKEEASRLKSELRTASLTRQSAEQHIKELEQENRRLMALLSEQQDVHRMIMQQTLGILNDAETEDPPLDAPRHPDTSPDIATDVSIDAPIHKNGSEPKNRKPRRKSNRRRRRSKGPSAAPRPIVPSQG